MFTWALVYLARTKTLVPETFVPFFVAIFADCCAIYYVAEAIAKHPL